MFRLIKTIVPVEMPLGDGHRGFGDRVHAGRDQRVVEPDISVQAGIGVDRGGEDLGISRDQQHVIKGQRLGDAGFQVERVVQ